MSRKFTYRFSGCNKSELREISAFLLTNADRMAKEIAEQLSKEWGCKVTFSGPVDFYGERK